MTSVIEPIGGTVNMMCGIPIFGIQRFFMRDGVPEASTISLPIFGGLYMASDDGTFLNRDSIHTVEPRPPKECALPQGISDVAPRARGCRSV